MLYNFDTNDVDRATAALCVYVLWRSRSRRLKITPKIWGQVENWTKGSAKRAPNLAQFIEKLKPRLAVDTLNPRWMELGIKGLQPFVDSAGNTSYIESANAREFMTIALKRCDEERCLELLYKETAMTVLYVRDRLEREKPIEKQYIEENE